MPKNGGAYRNHYFFVKHLLLQCHLCNKTINLGYFHQKRKQIYSPLRFRPKHHYFRLVRISTPTRGLREDSSTGPDHLSTKILKYCDKSPERPITIMARKVLTSGSSQSQSQSTDRVRKGAVRKRTRKFIITTYPLNGWIVHLIYYTMTITIITKW